MRAQVKDGEGSHSRPQSPAGAQNLRFPVARVLDRQARLLAGGELVLDKWLCPYAVAAPASTVDDAGIDH